MVGKQRLGLRLQRRGYTAGVAQLDIDIVDAGGRPGAAKGDAAQARIVEIGPHRGIHVEAVILLPAQADTVVQRAGGGGMAQQQVTGADRTGGGVDPGPRLGVGLPGDDVDGGHHGIGAEYRRVRAANHLDPLDVLQRDAQRVPLHAGEDVAVDGTAVDQHFEPGGQREFLAMVGDDEVTTGGVGDLKARHEPEYVGELVEAGILDHLAGDDGGRDRRFQQRLRQPRRRHHDGNVGKKGFLAIGRHVIGIGRVAETRQQRADRGANERLAGEQAAAPAGKFAAAVHSGSRLALHEVLDHCFCP